MAQPRYSAREQSRKFIPSMDNETIRQKRREKYKQEYAETHQTPEALANDKRRELLKTLSKSNKENPAERTKNTEKFLIDFV